MTYLEPYVLTSDTLYFSFQMFFTSFIFSFCSFQSVLSFLHMLLQQKHLNRNSQNNKVTLACVKIHPEIYKLIRKQVVCNGRFAAKAFVFLAVSSRKLVLGLKWTNDENIEFISSQLSTNGNLG